MDFHCYIAMTAAEFWGTGALPAHPAWMACHFSCYGTGLSNLPTELPEGAMVILNDRTPPAGHDPEYIATQLCELKEALNFSCILLDFQRQGSEESARIAKHIFQALDCPVGISEGYAHCTDGPVFVGMPKPNRCVNDVTSPWKGREIWLEAALETQIARITHEGCQLTTVPFSPMPENAETEPELRCRYHAEAFSDHALITLYRDIPQLELLLQDARDMGVTKAVGLYQQLGFDFMDRK